MVQVSYPGVYIQEVPSGVRTITGVSTSITAFVGAAADGPMFAPTVILNFTDYTRLFADDTSKGEMTDQVRQFFLNGGSQAIIVRVANGAAASTRALLTNNGATALSMTARNLGKSGDLLRAYVDYNTPTPERTFNLHVYSEILDESGDGTRGTTEEFPDVSVDPASPRFVKTVLEQTSTLVGAVTVPTTTALGPAASISALFGDTDVAFVDAAIAAAVVAAGPTGTHGKFRVRVGAASTIVTVKTTGYNATPATRVTEFLAEIQDDLTPLGASTTATIFALSAARFVLKIESAAGATSQDVSIEPAPDADIAIALGLGTAQGGVEVGRYARHRPAPSGFVSELSDSDAVSELVNLGELLPLLQANFTDGFTMSAPLSFSVASMTFPFPATNLEGALVANKGTLTNLRSNLLAIVNAINAATTRWRAELHGYRIALIPIVGNAATGPGHTLGGLPANFFSGATANALALPFTSGADGSKPIAANYTTAYTNIAAKVDLFNILVLPKSTGDIDSDRDPLWGPASSFCQSRRAFLLIDAMHEVDSIDDVLAEVLERRIGIVKDHSALYWPRLRINPDGSPRFIDATGSVAGIMARIDNSRGVWKAPAGLDSDVRGVLGVHVPMSDPENGRINPQAVNAIRVFTNGILSWGARTMDGFDNSGNDDYKYVPVRRLALFLEESLVRGLKFAVFEPNDEPLWAQIRTAVGSFLNTLFRQGAFQGRTTRDAYFVKVDSETTTQNDINRGIVNVIVGFAPLKPAEFVVITIQQKAGQVQV